MNTVEPSALATYYGDDFYKGQVQPSLRAARIYMGLLWRHLQPRSVVDVGCGRGSWLAACRELGSTSLYGLDGDWNTQSAMIDVTIRFRAVDLNEPFTVDEKVDLAISVEVAEHLKPSASKQFVESLTRAADVVVFGAAYKGQGGTNHINEQRHSFWARLFLAKGFVPFDLFRPAVWGNDRIHYWYRQNTFLYVKRESAAAAALGAAGLSAIPDIVFVDCIHPDLYESHAGIVLSFRTHLRDILPSLARAIRRRVRR